MLNALALCGLVALSNPARADGDGFRLGLAGGVFIADSRDKVLDNAWTLVLRPGWDFNHTFGLEADLAYNQGTTRTVDRLFTIIDPRINLLVHAKPLGPVTFFGAVGPGIAIEQEHVKEGDPAYGEHPTTNEHGYGLYEGASTKFLLNAGPGAWLRFGQSPFGLRTDFRYMLTIGGVPADFDGDPTTLESDILHNWEWTLSLQARLGQGAADTDKDGIPDDSDRCIDDPEDKDDFEDTDGCPDLDNDDDGILDADDECALDPEDRDDFQDADGCPDPDNDEDGIVDQDDRCINDPGTAEAQGCPDRDGDTLADMDDECPDEPGPVEAGGCPDQDGDRVPDKRDECPTEPADPRVDPSRSNGCPERVVVTTDEVVILDKVYFDTDQATIKRSSYPILNDVAEVLKKYPDIKLVEIQGHTDSQASDEYNLDLSQRRAEAVRQYLIDKGVEPERLVAKGYGESQPIDTNDTAEGRARNRRVQFLIVEQ
ncbi:MAG: OmpA family protein [Deltaproteobacteria bacterium]|nr:MAG: OmpA family protein [Deltaproteobacteria bacterium]